MQFEITYSLTRKASTCPVKYKKSHLLKNTSHVIRNNQN